MIKTKIKSIQKINIQKEIAIKSQSGLVRTGTTNIMELIVKLESVLEKGGERGPGL